MTTEFRTGLAKTDSPTIMENALPLAAAAARRGSFLTRASGGLSTSNPTSSRVNAGAVATLPVPAGGGTGAADRRSKSATGQAAYERRALDIGSPTGLERRRGPGRRLSEDRKSAEEGQLSDEQFEFVLAIDTYKRLNSRPFPSWTEILEVAKQLGYRKVAASTLALPPGIARAQTRGASAEAAVSAAISPPPAPAMAARPPHEPPPEASSAQVAESPAVTEIFQG